MRQTAHRDQKTRRFARRAMSVVALTREPGAMLLALVLTTAVLAVFALPAAATVAIAAAASAEFVVASAAGEVP